MRLSKKMKKIGRGETIKTLYGEKIALVGFARDQKPILDFLKHSPEHKNAEIWVLDKNETLEVPPGVHAKLGPDYLADLSEFDLAFRTPGIPYLSPEIQKALHGGTIISSATKLFMEEVRKLPSKPLVVGVTGTKGKGTTCTLLYNILHAAKKKVFLAGNIGVSALELLPELRKLSKKDRPIVILEMSSFQLQDLNASPDVAVVLEIFPDHQDAHKDLAEYYAAKANIAAHQTEAGRTFFFLNNEMSAQVARPGVGLKLGVDENNFTLFGPEDLSVPGYHNFKNAVMAATVAQALKVPLATIKRVARDFTGTEHRLEFVRRVDHVDFYNDSASTNPQTTAAAALSFPGMPHVLIAGGADKNLDYAPLAQALKESNTAAVILAGENSPKIEKAIKGAKVPLEHAAALEEAVQKAYAKARALSGSRAIVVFSPGATSFDMFRDYKDRGEQFKKIVAGL